MLNVGSAAGCDVIQAACRYQCEPVRVGSVWSSCCVFVGASQREKPILFRMNHLDERPRRRGKRGAKHLVSTLITIQFSPCYLDSEILEPCTAGGEVSLS